MPTHPDRTTLLEGLVEAALVAGAAIQRHFDADVGHELKADNSPVTAADRDAEAIILAALARLDPETPVVAEEEAAAGRTPQVAGRFYLVDPLDGTREFVRRGTDFTVNIGLVEAGVPTLGVVYAPARAALYVGDAARGLAWRARVEPGAPRAGAHAHGLPHAGGPALGGRLAQPRRPAHGPLSCGARRGRAGQRRLLAQAGAGGGGRGRPLPPHRPDHGVGHRGRPRRAAGRGRAHGRAGRVAVRYGKPGFRNGAFVASGPFDPPPIGPCM